MKRVPVQGQGLLQSPDITSHLLQPDQIATQLWNSFSHSVQSGILRESAWGGANGDAQCNLFESGTAIRNQNGIQIDASRGNISTENEQEKNSCKQSIVERGSDRPQGGAFNLERQAALDQGRIDPHATELFLHRQTNQISGILEPILHQKQLLDLSSALLALMAAKNQTLNPSGNFDGNLTRLTQPPAMLSSTNQNSSSQTVSQLELLASVMQLINQR